MVPDGPTISWRGAAMAVVAVAALAFMPALGRHLAAERVTTGARSDDPLAREARNRSAMAQILGEFRTNLGDLVFMKTEVYLDSGIRYQPHVDLAEIAASGTERAEGRPLEQAQSPRTADATTTLERFESRIAAQAGSDAHEHEHCDDPSHDHAHDHEQCDDPTHDHAHENASHPGDAGFVDTIIPRPETDFRGFVGRLHRQVKPWRDPREPHKHTPGTELLPWYRLATLGDPHNVRSFVIGAWWLKSMKTPEQLAEAERFVLEGIRHNPGAFQLHLMRGYVLRAKERDADALEAFRQAADLALNVRPLRGSPDENWTDYNEDDAGAACNLAVLLTRDLHGVHEAHALAMDYARRGERVPGLAFTLSRLEERLAAEDGTTTASAPAP